MDNDRAATARAVFARIRQGPSRMTSIPHPNNTDSTSAAASHQPTENKTPPAPEPRLGSIEDKSKSTDVAADSQMQTERSDSVMSQSPATSKRTTLVFESHVSINPRDTCLAAHHNGKRAVETVKQCRYADCYESHFDPANAKPKPYRMLTANKLADLERWLTTPNARHEDGKRRERQREAESIGSDHFTLDDLRGALTYGIEKIQESHVEVESLAVYFEKHYSLFFLDLCRDAVPISHFPRFEVIAGMERPDLVYEMIRAATQIDYLRDEIEELNREIVKTKWAAAKKGEDFEIRELLRLGYIELEQDGGKDEGVLRLG
ncbi:hypothetical protein DOTSEDRAFT_24407 [Dothistroma septosporum NZE10]|uniref:Uncharacterized protein n=1 Tax=Dothistroma septosporum (strain NZE10 / CBS 128990) TaxID=675120 RepID=N1PPJ1_DOTSN|nr:hypothetical protein DOTSEDRAFT_24407 [Dothistroma septosporum NZE10]